MGTEVHLVVVGPGADQAVLQGERRIEDLERRWSRFLPGSEISQLNAARGKATVVSADTYNVIDQAVSAWAATGGSYDPTVLPAMRAIGYDRSFDRIDGVVPVAGDEVRPAPGCGGVQLDPAARLVVLPPDVELDLGGLGKGFAADLLVSELLDGGADGACVNIGGDVRVEGASPTASGWVVGLRDSATVSTRAVALASGAVCTSTTRRRRWLTSAGPRHHLLDPRTGLPVDNGLATVTVIGARAAQAEVLTKVAFVAGPDDAPALLAPFGVAALLILDDGSTVEVGELEEMAA
jgi:thiamine biosynthesis lipoprotein